MRRWAWRRRWASSGGPGSRRTRPISGRSCRCPAAGWSCSSSWPASGIKQIEFAGYGQNAANPGGAAPNPAPGGVTTPESRAAYLAYGRTLRGFLDGFELQAIGNHGFIPNTWPGPNSPGGGMSVNDYERFQTELEFASILGMPYMGTGNDPTSANNRNIEPWTISGEKWEALNELSLQWGIHLYPHNHSPAYNFLQDGPMVTVTEDRVTGAPIPPTQVRGESGKRLMQHYLDITDPDLCVIEMDIYWAHVAQHQWRWRYDWEGNRVEDIFDPIGQVARQTKRYAPVPHEGRRRTAQPPGVGNGYSIIPFGDPRSDIDFEHVLRQHRGEGLPQLQLRAGQRPRRRRRPRTVAAPHQDQRPQHEPTERLIARATPALRRLAGRGPHAARR